jgi:hypothetical protein
MGTSKEFPSNTPKHPKETRELKAYEKVKVTAPDYKCVEKRILSLC